MPATTLRLLDITVKRDGAVWEIRVAGELDTASGAELVSTIAAVVGATPGVVDIDLSDVTFADTAGWRAVHEARQLIIDSGGTPRVVAMSPAVERLIRQWVVVGGSAAA
jgi:anti-anti-sigma factor